MVSDITDRKRAEAEREKLLSELQVFSGELERRVELRTGELRDSLREKETLLKEVHHRVKNNLQVIRASSSYSRFICPIRPRETCLPKRRAACSRSRSFTRSSTRPRISRIHIAPIRLPVDHAIPCGLILNELVSNALKHGFPLGRQGNISVTVNRVGTDVRLVVSDDGVGLPPQLDPRKSTSLGLDLVFTFADQLEATVEVQRGGGTAFLFTFRDAPS